MGWGGGLGHAALVVLSCRLHLGHCTALPVCCRSSCPNGNIGIGVLLSQEDVCLHAGVRKLNSRQLMKGLLDLGELTSLNMQNQPELTDETLRVVSTLAGHVPYFVLILCCCSTYASCAVVAHPTALVLLSLCL